MQEYEDLLPRLLETARRHRMWAPGDRIVVAVSGGPDSVALLHLFTRVREDASLSLVVAHLNHQLRGEQADEEARFVDGLAREWGLPAVVDRAPVAELARERALSLQEAAREARYSFLLRVAEEQGASRIALAHHGDDQVETVLFRFLRGTGPRGLAGIPPVRGMVIRPLLDVSREEIMEYCRFHGLPYRLDPSNESLRYQRNRIRRELIPYLERHYNPRLRWALRRLAEIQREEDDFLEQYAEQIYRSLAREVDAATLEGGRAEVGEVFLPREELLRLHPAVQRRVLRRALARLRIPGKALGWEHIRRLLESPPGRIMLPGAAAVEIRPGEFHFARRSVERGAPGFDFPIQVPGTYRLDGIGRELRFWQEPADRHYREGLARLLRSAAPEEDASVPGEGPETGQAAVAERWEAVLAWDALRPPLRLRSRRPGDRFHPFGMTGTRKLQDFFVDEKVDREIRDHIPLLVDEEGIVCVIGYRIAERARVTGETREVLRIQMQPLVADPAEETEEGW